MEGPTEAEVKAWERNVAIRKWILGLALSILALGVIARLGIQSWKQNPQLGNSEPVASSTATTTSASQPAMKTVVDIPQLIGKSPAEVDKVLGRPIRITKITNDPDMMPGEYRDYKIEKSIGTLTEDGLWVRFYRGKADHFTVDLPHLADTPQAALLMVGIDVKGAEAKLKAPLADRWFGNFSGIDFKDVAALRMDAGGKKYSTVQAEIAK